MCSVLLKAENIFMGLKLFVILFTMHTLFRVQFKIDNESHGVKLHDELFYVTEKDLELIDIESIFDDDKRDM